MDKEQDLFGWVGFLVLEMSQTWQIVVSQLLELKIVLTLMMHQWFAMVIDVSKQFYLALHQVNHTYN